MSSFLNKDDLRLPVEQMWWLSVYPAPEVYEILPEQPQIELSIVDQYISHVVLKVVRDYSSLASSMHCQQTPMSRHIEHLKSALEKHHADYRSAVSGAQLVGYDPKRFIEFIRHSKGRLDEVVTSLFQRIELLECSHKLVQRSFEKIPTLFYRKMAPVCGADMQILGSANVIPFLELQNLLASRKDVRKFAASKDRTSLHFALSLTQDVIFRGYLFGRKKLPKKACIKKPRDFLEKFDYYPAKDVHVGDLVLYCSSIVQDPKTLSSYCLFQHWGVFMGDGYVHEMNPEMALVIRHKIHMVSKARKYVQIFRRLDYGEDLPGERERLERRWLETEIVGRMALRKGRDYKVDVEGLMSALQSLGVDFDDAEEVVERFREVMIAKSQDPNVEKDYEFIACRIFLYLLFDHATKRHWEASCLGDPLESREVGDAYLEDPDHIGEEALLIEGGGVVSKHDTEEVDAYLSIPQLIEEQGGEFLLPDPLLLIEKFRFYLEERCEYPLEPAHQFTLSRLLKGISMLQ